MENPDKYFYMKVFFFLLRMKILWLSLCQFHNYIEIEVRIFFKIFLLCIMFTFGLPFPTPSNVLY